MNKKDLELFKQAIDEGISNRFDKLAAACTEEIVCSERHNLAMQAIVYGKIDTKRTWSPRMKRIVAILVAAALLLTSCGIIFRNEIKEIFSDFFVSVKYDNNDKIGQTLDNIYYLSYIPDGYIIEDEIIGSLFVQYRYIDDDNHVIIFTQNILNGMEYIIDSENGYSEMIEIDKIKVYYRYTGEMHIFVWNDDNYSLKLTSNNKLTDDEIAEIVDGIKAK
jgi:hypothetical protein